MMRAWVSYCCLIVALSATGIASATSAATEFQIPALSGPVVDQAGMFRQSTREKLSTYLRQISERSGTQLQVATVSDLAGLSIEEAATKITDQWKIGRQKEDRGILLLFAPKERRVRIEVGLGLQGDLPDVTANRIIREVIAPRLRDGTPDRALINGVMAILHYTDPGLLNEDGEPATHPQKQKGKGSVVWIFWFLFLMFFILPIFSRRWRYVVGSAGLGGIAGGLGGGGWGSGGGSGGGWSGGGGGFNGGGSSGSW